MFVQPFPIQFTAYDFHGMLYLKNHPVYEAAEAMIKLRNSGVPEIRALLTLHDGTQVEHVNVLQDAALTASDRQVVYTPIQYRKTGNDRNMHLVIQWKSYRGEEFILDLKPVGAAAAARAGLIDPREHSIHSSLPVMFPEKTTLAHKHSRVNIDGKDWDIPVKIHIPLLFKGMEGYYSEGFSIGALRSCTREAAALQKPVTLTPGEGWSYRIGNKTVAYRITARDGQLLTVLGKDELVLLELHDGSPRIKKVTVLSADIHGRTADFSLEFSPSVPLYPPPERFSGYESTFAVSMNGHHGLVSGSLNMDADSKGMRIKMCPSSPDWAVKRAVEIEIKGWQDQYKLVTRIKQA